MLQIRSDKETSQEIVYSLTGPGVDQNPQGRFSVDRKTGFVKVHSILDREEFAQYHVREPKNRFAVVFVNIVKINEMSKYILLFFFSFLV